VFGLVCTVVVAVVVAIVIVVVVVGTVAVVTDNIINAVVLINHGSS